MLRNKGIKIRLLTNSYKSNDVTAVYAGYRAYRKELLAIGVELYELKADVGNTKVVNRSPVEGLTNSGLHAKIILFDEKDVFIGSFNLDPRSAHINTEEGLYVSSTSLAKRVIGYMDEGINLKHSYRLSLNEKGKILWTTIEDGKVVTYEKEPNFGGFDKLKVNMMQLIPLEAQL